MAPVANFFFFGKMTPISVPTELLTSLEAEAVLIGLARVFFDTSRPEPVRRDDDAGPNAEARYRVLLDQIPAVVFMAYLDQGIGEAYVSPQIESSLGFSQQEWLEDPVLWYQQIHPDDKDRWSREAANMFLSGQALRSSYRVMARDGRVIWFQCEARLVRRDDGRPWFIHGVGFDITELKQVERALQDERNFVSATLDTVGALVVVLDAQGRITRFNRACELTTGYAFEQVRGRLLRDLFLDRDDIQRFETMFEQLRVGILPSDYESYWTTATGERRLISWSTTVLGSDNGAPAHASRSRTAPTHIIATGIDVTERKRLERAALEISAREQRRIGQDLHDDLGQHLTGIAFLAKVLQDRLKESGVPETVDAAKIVELVNEAIRKTRELARGLLPVLSESRGLMSALERWAREVSDVFHLSCRLECREPVLIHENTLADHLYYIAVEAVNNAIKHGRAKNILIRLGKRESGGILMIEDDGSGFEIATVTPLGLGLNIMNYRAKMAGGSLEMHSTPGGGTVVACFFPVVETDD
jgi:PAS domain S-box-containing protein